MRYAIGLLCFLTACGTTAHVGPRYDDAIDFSRYSTFAWTAGTRVGFSGDPPTALQQRVAMVIQESVEREFARGGFVLLSRSDEADLIVRAQFTSFSRYVISDRAVQGYAEQYGWARDVTQALLFLEILDRNSARVVWENSVSTTIFGNLEREATIRELATLVDRVLAVFPP